MRVRRSAPSIPPGATSARSVTLSLLPASIVRNFSSSNTRPSRPTRRWRKITGPGELRRTASASPSSTSERTISASNANTRSIACFTVNCQPADDRMGREQRKTADWIELAALADRLVQARHSTNAEAAVTARDQFDAEAVDPLVGEREDHVAQGQVSTRRRGWAARTGTPVATSTAAGIGSASKRTGRSRTRAGQQPAITRARRLASHIRVGVMTRHCPPRCDLAPPPARQPQPRRTAPRRRPLPRLRRHNHIIFSGSRS